MGFQPLFISVFYVTGVIAKPSLSFPSGAIADMLAPSTRVGKL